MAKFRPVNLKAIKSEKDKEEEEAKDKVQDRFENDGQKTEDYDPYKYTITDSGTFEFDKIKVKKTGIHVDGKEEAVMTPSSHGDPTFEPQRNYIMDDFKIIKKIGGGAQGSVYKVENKHTGDIYAQKKLVMDDQNAQGRHLITELQSLYDCECMNVIRLYHAFYHSGALYMMIEFMNMGSLEDFLKNYGAIPEQTIAKFTVQILNGLIYLHETKRIVHRDIKPANVLVNNKGLVKLADFGMAGHYENKDIFNTFQGTGQYMSPERLRGAPHSYNSDVWSLGLTLAECALGKFPATISEQAVLFGSSLDFSFMKSFSPEFRQFLGACLCPANQRCSARQLLNHPFIQKYYQTKPTFKKWLKTEYLPKRIQQAKRKRKKKDEKEKKSS